MSLTADQEKGENQTYSKHELIPKKKMAQDINTCNLEIFSFFFRYHSLCYICMYIYPNTEIIILIYLLNLLFSIERCI